MSRALPAHPNLEHLKHQAKELLPDLQRRQPDAKLADALHAIAREYGFRTWPELKAHVALKPNPLAGTWTANLAKSARHPLHPFQRATLQFVVIGETVTITNTGVDPSGREERGEHTIQADGREHLMPGGGGYAVTARWLGSHTLETVATRNGRIVGQGTYEVSPDGHTLTVSARNPS